MYLMGTGGVERNRELALKHLTIAADRGHALALYYKGELLIGDQANDVETYQCFLASAQLGCPAAMQFLAVCLDCGGFGRNRDRVQAVLWYAKAAEMGEQDALIRLNFVLKQYPLECIPYGIWRPERIYQRLLPAEMRQVLVTWLLVAKRRRVARYVALLVCSFIVTK
jgi:TPR repeat protein